MSSPSPSPSKMVTTEGSEKEGSEYNSEEKGMFEYFGWVDHVGVNSIGHEYCHLRFLILRGRYVEMYKRDPHENPGIKPIRKGVIGHTLMVEELGRRRVNQGDVYVLRFYNRLDKTKKGEIACATAGEARKWMEAFDQAKQQVEYELSRGGITNRKLSVENELNLEGHRPRVRRGLRKLIRIGKGPETLLHRSSGSGDFRAERYFECDAGDAIEEHEWKCVHTINGIRIFEDVADSKVPAKPNYSLVLYYGADRPIRKESLLGRFVNGTDIFRNERLKLIPSIIEGYWMVKRAVGRKACLLGKAVTCKYLRQDNFLEIDVDIGSSSVARSIIGLVLGYVTSIVVDLAILLEAKEEDELPEYILGTVQLNRVRIDSAIPFEV